MLHIYIYIYDISRLRVNNAVATVAIGMHGEAFFSVSDLKMAVLNVCIVVSVLSTYHNK